MATLSLRRRRWPWVAGVTVIVALAAAGSWIAYTARQAQQHLEATAIVLPTVQAAWQEGDAAKGEVALQRVGADSAAAYRKTHDPVWAAAAAVPVLGQPLDTVRGLTAAVRQLTTTALPGLAGAAELAEPERLLTGPGQVDVDRITRLGAPLQQAAATLSQQEDDVAGLAPSWLPQVAKARSDLLRQLAPVAGNARSAATAAQLVPPMLGSEGPRSYFVAFQNPAEARGTGGLLDAFLILRADQGKLSIGRVGSNEQLPKLPAEIPGLDPTYRELYAGRGATSLWVSSNLSPDLPEVGQAWAAMWSAATGQKLDGAVTLDPSSLAGVLAATGPIQVPRVGTVDAGTVQQLVLVHQYARQDAVVDGVVTRRKNAMLGVGTGAMDRVLSGQFDAAKLVDGLIEAGRGRHVQVFSTAAGEENLLEGAGIAGQVSRTRGPFEQTVVVNTGGTKLDAYLRTDTRYVVTSCSGKERRVRVTVTLKNTAPASGLPPYVTTRADGRTVPPGQNRLDVQVLLTTSAAVTGARLDRTGLTLTAPDGKLPAQLSGARTVFLDQGQQVGRPSYGIEVELPPGATRTLSLDVVEPPSSYPPQMPSQVMATPATATSDIAACR